MNHIQLQKITEILGLVEITKIDYPLEGGYVRLNSGWQVFIDIAATGTISWYKRQQPASFGRLHRVDKPAVEYASGRKEWYLDGQRTAPHLTKRHEK